MLFGLFFLFFVFVSAAPPSSSSSQTPTSLSPTSSTSSHAFNGSTSHRPFSTKNRPHVLPTPSRSHSITIIPPDFSTATHPRPITHPRPSNIFHQPSPENSNQSTIAIVFEVLGGLVGLVIAFFLLRCCNNYRKTPRRDRIADILHRHQLQRELEEIERNPAILRRPSLREPAPPYFPRPPSYDDLAPSLMRITPRTEYAPLTTYSPPPSPPMSQRPLPSSGPTAHRPAEFTPSLPSG